jgi:rhodanese-related sulfurtransferase
VGIVDSQLEVSCAQAEEALRTDGAQVVDVREPYEWEAGRVPGARHIELERLGSSADTIDPQRPVIFQCRAGIRSAMAAQAFRRAGYDAWSMAGGLEAWAAAGLPLEPRDGHVAPH